MNAGDPPAGKRPAPKRKWEVSSTGGSTGMETRSIKTTRDMHSPFTVKTHPYHPLNTDIKTVFGPELGGVEARRLLQAATLTCPLNSFVNALVHSGGINRMLMDPRFVDLDRVRSFLQTIMHVDDVRQLFAIVPTWDQRVINASQKMSSTLAEKVKTFLANRNLVAELTEDTLWLPHISRALPFLDAMRLTSLTLPERHSLVIPYVLRAYMGQCTGMKVKDAHVYWSRAAYNVGFKPHTFCIANYNSHHDVLIKSILRDQVMAILRTRPERPDNPDERVATDEAVWMALHTAENFPFVAMYSAFSESTLLPQHVVHTIEFAAASAPLTALHFFYEHDATIVHSAVLNSHGEVKRAHFSTASLPAHVKHSVALATLRTAHSDKEEVFMNGWDPSPHEVKPFAFRDPDEARRMTLFTVKGNQDGDYYLTENPENPIRAHLYVLQEVTIVCKDNVTGRESAMTYRVFGGVDTRPSQSIDEYVARLRPAGTPEQRVSLLLIHGSEEEHRAALHAFGTEHEKALLREAEEIEAKHVKLAKQTADDDTIQQAQQAVSAAIAVFKQRWLQTFGHQAGFHDRRRFSSKKKTRQRRSRGRRGSSRPRRCRQRRD